VVAADVLDAAQVAQAVAGHDAIISAYNPGWGEPQIHDLFLQGSQAILDGAKQAGVKRVLVVGGAGSLFVAPGLQLVDTPEFPAAYKQGALAARELLKRLQGESALDWSFVSPPIALALGERTGQYRLGADELLTGQGDQPAGISVPDLAVAIVDEIEQPRHVQRRFTVAN
jgi:putative NADH-flavin reductase